MRSKHRDLLQKIITDAEEQKIQSARNKISIAEDGNEDEIEIIYYNEDDNDGESNNNNEGAIVQPFLVKNEEEEQIVASAKRARFEMHSVVDVIPEEVVQAETAPKEVEAPVEEENAEPVVIKTLPKRKAALKKSKVTKVVKKKPEMLVKQEDEDTPIFLNDEDLKRKIGELLAILIDESILKKLGFGIKPVEEVLCSVIEQCGRKPTKNEDNEEQGGDYTTRMRENTKQLFSMVLDEEHVQALLNNHTVDEVITIVLKMAK